MTEDRELQKHIAEEAQVDPASTPTPLVRAFQFFLVPLLIVGACVLVYVLLNYLVSNPRSAKEWLKDVKEGGPNTRPHAALQLAQTLRRMKEPDTTLTADILELYRASSPSEDALRSYLVTCLGILRDPRASELLLEVARTQTNMETRTAAFDALGAIKDPSTLDDLVKFLDDKEDLVRKYAAFNVGAVAEKAREESRGAAVEALRARLSDASADVGWNAAFALAYFLNDRSGTDTLKKMLDRKYLGEKIRKDDPNRDTLEARAIFIACNAAARLKDPSFLPLLKELTDDAKEKDSDVRFAAHQAIHQIQEKK